MTVEELIEQLQACDPTDEVRLAIQPSYPFQHHLSAVVSMANEASEGCDVELEEGEDAWWCETHETSGDGMEELTEHQVEAEEAPGVVYLAEGGQLHNEPYLPGDARRAIGW